MIKYNFETDATEIAKISTLLRNKAAKKEIPSIDEKFELELYIMLLQQLAGIEQESWTSTDIIKPIIEQQIYERWLDDNK